MVDRRRNIRKVSSAQPVQLRAQSRQLPVCPSPSSGLFLRTVACIFKVEKSLLFIMTRRMQGQRRQDAS